MPNWCSNDLEIKGDRAEFKEFMERFSKDGLEFEKYLPVPDGVACVQDWKLANWGCQNDPPSESIQVNRHASNAQIYFDTAWRPANEFVKRLSGLYPKLSFELIWEEGGNGLYGHMIYRHGVEYHVKEELEMEKTKSQEKTWDPREYAVDHLREALNTMSYTCVRAMQTLVTAAADDRPVEDMASTVMHDLAWGFANATTSIETALRSDSRERQKEDAMGDK